MALSTATAVTGNEVVVAYDIGTTGVKASAFAATGQLLVSTTETYATTYAAGGIAEQDPAAWWEAVARATPRLLADAGKDRHVAAIGISGQMMAAVLLDARGRPTRPAIIWADTRSAAECALLEQRVGMDEAYVITGHRLNPTYSLSKIMWVRRHEPDVWRRTKLIVQPKDVVALRLTGQAATDPSDASSTNAFDQRTSTWSARLLEAAELPTELLPRIRPSTDVIGEVTRAASAETGLPVGTPVVVGGGDGPCASLGAGIVSADSGAYCYLGTSSWVSIASDAPLHDPQKRTMTFNHVVPGRFVPTATMQAGGGSLEWVVDVLAPRTDPARYTDLLAEAANAPAAADGLLFLPHLLGERSPYWNPRARGTFIGLAKHHTRGHLVRAVLEGVAMNLRTGLLAFAEMGHAADTIDVIGGGASSDLWLQILADTWGIPVRRRSLVEEANGLGAMLLAAIGTGLVDSFDQAPAFSKVTGEFVPSPDAHGTLDTRYPQFLEAYRRLEPMFDVLAG